MMSLQSSVAAEPTSMSLSLSRDASEDVRERRAAQRDGGQAGPRPQV